MNPKEEFRELLCEISRRKGLNELSSRIFGTLYAEPREISLEELSERTGYSMSSVSTIMKLMCDSEMIKRIKKPKSKKVYFYMEKNIVSKLLDMMKENQKIILYAKEKVPKIIQRYKSEKMPKRELEIVENYFKQLKIMEDTLKRFIKILERKKVNE